MPTTNIKQRKKFFCLLYCIPIINHSRFVFFYWEVIYPQSNVGLRSPQSGVVYTFFNDPPPSPTLKPDLIIGATVTAFQVVNACTSLPEGHSSLRKEAQCLWQTYLERWCNHITLQYQTERNFPNFLDRLLYMMRAQKSYSGDRATHWLEVEVKDHVQKQTTPPSALNSNLSAVDSPLTVNLRQTMLNLH